MPFGMWPATELSLIPSLGSEAEWWWMPVAAKVDDLLRTAITQKRLVELIYKEKTRILEPHDYGLHKGTVKLLGYQVGGSSTGPLPNWRWMEVNSISGIHLLDKTFPGGRKIPSGKHHGWDQLFLRVKPPEDE
jgi:hypothetical protein